MRFPANFWKFLKAAFLEKNEKKFVSYRYSDEMIIGTWFINLFPHKIKKILR